jgi:2-octaprenylphenol hydroxylase
VSRDFDMVIVGAGVIGTAMASLLLARKLSSAGKVAVVGERLPTAAAGAAEWDVRVYALSRASQRVLTLCGAWQRLASDRLCPYERMCVWDANGEPQGRGSLSFDCAELGEPNLGHIVEGRELQAQCLEAARAAGVVLIEASVTAVMTGDAECRIRLNDGRELRSPLLIAADGAESKTRELLGIETAGHAYHQDALVAHVRTAKAHRSTAWQRFLSTGPLAFLPLPDGRVSIVWSTGHAEAARLRTLKPAAFADALTVASGEVLGRCELTTPLASFPLKLQYAVHYARPRAVLLGDAAHSIHPLAGQGLNLGLLDCASLADVLGKAAPGSLGEYGVLRRYERWRRSENLITAGALDGLERLFSTTNGAVSAVRAAGLSAMGKLPFIKRQLAQRALGLGGDVPDFLRRDPA